MTRIAGFRKRWEASLGNAAEAVALFNDLLAYAADLEAGEKELSDSYLRIREMVGAWNTKPGGVDRFEVTEKAVLALVGARPTEIDRRTA